MESLTLTWQFEFAQNVQFSLVITCTAIVRRQQWTKQTTSGSQSLKQWLWHFLYQTIFALFNFIVTILRVTVIYVSSSTDILPFILANARFMQLAEFTGICLCVVFTVYIAQMKNIETQDGVISWQCILFSLARVRPSSYTRDVPSGLCAPIWHNSNIYKNLTI